MTYPKVKYCSKNIPQNPTEGSPLRSEVEVSRSEAKVSPTEAEVSRSEGEVSSTEA